MEDEVEVVDDQHFEKIREQKRQSIRLSLRKSIKEIRPERQSLKVSNELAPIAELDNEFNSKRQSISLRASFNMNSSVIRSFGGGQMLNRSYD